jgi:hypothetical protein
MITLLRRLFIKDYTNVGEESIRVKHGKVGCDLWHYLQPDPRRDENHRCFHFAKQRLRILSTFLPIALVADAINNLADMAILARHSRWLQNLRKTRR